MNNKGQTTVFFSLMISVLLLFTLSALEIVRIHTSKVKMIACVHSMHSSILADYNSELFERYHLLFMDPTYGTGSEAALEEKIKRYLETSLNGETVEEAAIYRFTLEEIALANQKNILDEDMKQVKDQITDYEKTAGLVNQAKKLAKKMKQKTNDINHAVRETEMNGTESAIPQKDSLNNSQKKEEKNIGTDNQETEKEKIEVDDPRKILNDSLKFGTLAFLLPDCQISKENHDFSLSPSAHYEKQKEGEKDTSFQDLSFLKNILKKSTEENFYNKLEQQAAFVDYVSSSFSNVLKKQDNSVMICEAEYIVEGKDSDYDNLQAVVDEIIWMRMPVNYACLLTDAEKKSEALTMAAAICTATGTEALIEVVKYLLLGCWAYGETLCEVKGLLEGEKIAYMKTKENWQTELKNLLSAKTTKEIRNGLSYEDYLMLLLAKKNGKGLNACYARMLDIIELNLQKQDADFKISNCIGKMTIQGKISVNPLYLQMGSKEEYEYYFEEEMEYK